MLTTVADGVLVHESEFLQSNAVIVRGPSGVLLIDAGVTGNEMAGIASDLRELGQPVVAGFSTHPHWDHLLWHAALGESPRYGTARCAAAVRHELADPEAKTRITEQLAETEVAGRVPLDLYGLITGLPEGTERIPWDGPAVRIIEHRAHAPGHAALLVENQGVLVAGDMLSDILIPFLDLEAARDPIGDYLDALARIEAGADGFDVVVPGHGSVGSAGELGERIELDRAYARALRGAGAADDPRLLPSAPHGSWLPDVHGWQHGRLSGRGEREGAPV